MDLKADKTTQKGRTYPATSKAATVLRVLVALFENPLSWSDLLQHTSLSRSTLSVALATLKGQGLVDEELVRLPRGRPSVNYRLSKIALKNSRLAPIAPILQEIRGIERKAQDLTVLSTKEAAAHPKDIERITRNYLGALVLASLVIFETSLLYETKDPICQDIMANEALSSIRRILWKNEFAQKFANVTKRELQHDKKYNLRALEEAIK